MADLDRAIKLLNHYDASKRRKGVVLMAKSGDPDAVRQLALAFKTEPDPEVRKLIQKTGRALKKKQMQQQAKATPKSTPRPQKQLQFQSQTQTQTHEIDDDYSDSYSNGNGYSNGNSYSDDYDSSDDYGDSYSDTYSNSNGNSYGDTYSDDDDYGDDNGYDAFFAQQDEQKKPSYTQPEEPSYDYGGYDEGGYFSDEETLYLVPGYIDADTVSEKSQQKTQEKQEKQQNAKPIDYESNRNAVKALLLLVSIAGFGLFLGIYLPWIDLSTLTYEDGTKLGDVVASYQNAVRNAAHDGISSEDHQKYVDKIDTQFSVYDIGNVMEGHSSLAAVIIQKNYLANILTDKGYVFYGTRHRQTYGSMIGTLGPFSIFSALLVGLLCIGSYASLADLQMQSSRSQRQMQAFIFIVGLVGKRLSLIISLLAGIPMLIVSISFITGGAQDFMTAAVTSWGHPVLEYNVFSMVQPGYYVFLVSSIVIVLGSGLALTFFPIEERYR